MADQTQDLSFYRVVSEPGETCPCGHGTQWTIVHLEGDDEVGISTSWQGPEGKELAEDICDLMNMAYEAGQESKERPDRIQKLERLLKLASELTVSLDRQTEDIGGSRKPLDIIQEIGPLCDELERPF